jgi:hypothetical protein
LSKLIGAHRTLVHNTSTSRLTRVELAASAAERIAERSRPSDDAAERAIRASVHPEPLLSLDDEQLDIAHEGSGLLRKRRATAVDRHLGGSCRENRFAQGLFERKDFGGMLENDSGDGLPGLNVAKAHVAQR